MAGIDVDMRPAFGRGHNLLVFDHACDQAKKKKRTCGENGKSSG